MGHQNMRLLIGVFLCIALQSCVAHQRDFEASYHHPQGPDDSLAFETKVPCNSALNPNITCDATCSYLYKCINNVESVIEQCTDAGKACYQPRVECRDVDICPKFESITCKKAERFPDPLSCLWYHECPVEDKDSEIMECATGTSFNLASGECDGTLDDPVCTASPVPHCLALVQSGALEQNKRYFYVCLRNSDGLLEPVMDMCPDGEYYYEDVNACEEIRTDPIHCTAAGRFPDPYNCVAFHNCDAADAVSTPEKCPTSSSYNYRDGDCSNDMDSLSCRLGPVPHCNQLGQTGALFEDNTYYYQCIKVDGVLVPRLYKCKFGLIFVEDDLRCNVIRPAPISCNNGPLLFPDPVWCTHYHNCTAAGGINSLPTYCGNFGYDMASQTCTLPLEHAACTDGPAPPCLELGQRGAFKDDNRFYYICERNDEDPLGLHHELYACGPLDFYNEDVLACVEDPLLTTPALPTTPAP